MSVYLVNNNEILENNISLGNPQGIQGGAYLSKIKANNDSFLIQLNKCNTKNGIVKTDKKIYCDLMFDIDDENTIDFFTQFEEIIKNLIFEKKDLWFHNEMDMDTIEYHWQSMLRQYQGNKYLLRTFIKKPKTHLSQNTLYVYDENETPLTLDDITKDKKLITIIKIASLKFTQQSFNIEIFLDQVMVLDDINDKPKCLIKKINNSQNKDIEYVLEKDTNQENINEENTNQENQENQENDSKNIIESLDKIECNEIDDSENELDIDDVESINLDTIENTTASHENENENSKNEHEEIKEKTHQETADLKENLNNVKKDISLAINEKKQDIKSSNDSFNLNNLDELDEVDISLSSNTDVVNLKPPNEVYNAIYKEVRKKAKEAKQRAIEAYLEVKRIKSLYGFNDIESSDEENSSEIF